MRNFLFMAFLVKQRHALWKVANGLGDGLFLPAPVLRQQLLVKTAQLLFRLGKYLAVQADNYNPVPVLRYPVIARIDNGFLQIIHNRIADTFKAFFYQLRNRPASRGCA